MDDFLNFICRKGSLRIAGVRGKDGVFWWFHHQNTPYTTSIAEVLKDPVENGCGGFSMWFIILGLINPNFAISNGLNGKNIPDLGIHLNMGGNS